MTSTASAPRLDRRSTGRTIAAAEPARWIAVLPLAATEQHGPHLPLGTDVMIARGLSGAGARAAAGRAVPATFPAAAAGRDFHRAYRLSGHADAADRGRRSKSWMAIGDSVARAGIRKLVMVTSHGGNSAAMTLVAQDLRARHGMLAVTTAGRASARRRDCSRRRNCATASMAARSRPRSCWRASRSRCAPTEIADFRSASIAMEKDYRWLSAQRPAPFAWQAQDLHASGAVGDATQATADEGPSNCSITARARSANCSPTSTASIWQRSAPARRPDPRNRCDTSTKHHREFLDRLRTGSPTRSDQLGMRTTRAA